MKYPHLTIALLLFAYSAGAQPQTEEEKQILAVNKTMEASYLQNTEKYREAILPAKMAQQLFEELGNGNGVIGSNSSIISNYIRLLEVDSAGMFVERNRADLEKYDPIVIVSMSNHFALGQYYLTVSNVDSALHYFQQLPLLLDQFSRDGVGIDPSSPDFSKQMQLYLSMMAAGMNSQLNLIYGHSYNGLGLAYFANLEYGRAELAFRTALRYYEQQESAEDQANALINLGQVQLMHRTQSDSFYVAAKVCFDQALDLLDQSATKDSAFLSLVHRFLGAASLAAGDSTEALTHYRKGHYLLERADGSNLAKIAWISKELFQHIYAAEMFRLTIPIQPEAESSTHLRQLETDLTAILATDHSLTDEFLVSIYSNIGQSNAALKDWDRAISWLEKALEVYWPNGSPLQTEEYDLAGIDFSLGTHGLNLLATIAGIYQKKFLQSADIADNRLARRFYRIAGDVLEAKRFGFSAHTGSTYLKEDALYSAEHLARLVYLGAIDAFRRSDLSPADKNEQLLDLMQRCKGFILNQTLQDIENLQHVTSAKRREERELKAQHNELKVKHAVAVRLNRPEEAAALAKALIISDQRLERFYRELPDNPRMETAAQSLSIAEIRNDLVKDDKTALLEYLLGENGQLYAACITMDTVVSVEIELPADWEEDLAGINAFTTDETAYRQVPKTRTYTTAAYQLYNLLIAPFSAYIKKVDHLIIDPDLQFHRLNFDCLLTAPTLTDFKDDKFKELPAYDQFPYLLQEYSTQYITSPVTLLAQGRMGYTEVEGRTDFVDYGGVEPLYERRISMDVDSFLDHLIYTELNVQPLPNVEMLHKVAPLFGNKVKIWTGENANEERLRTDLQSYIFNILHFSAHGFLNDRSPLASKILLTHMAADDAWDDALEVKELYNMQIRANLGIISSCNSGTSHFPPTSEGLISIGRAFFYAGCPSVLISKWSLKAQPTGQIVSATSKNLKQGMRTAKALQQAKLTYLNETTNQAELAPYFWAGLNLWGKNGRLFPGGE